MPTPINVGDSQAIVRQKILDILAYHNLSVAEITSWGVARSRLNFAATSLSLATFANTEVGSTVRAKINAINSAPALSAPANTVIPAITGTAELGEILTASDGTWTGYPNPTFARQWKRDGENIIGATTSSYTLIEDDIGSEITFSVTATNNQGTSTATSIETDAVVATPENKTLPTISGDAANGETLVAEDGSWIGYPTLIYSYQWKADGNNIVGATYNTLILNNSQVGKIITITVTATNSQGSDSVTSDATDEVTSEPINTVAPTITGDTYPGQVLTINNGTWVGYPSINYTYQWKLDGSDIIGETGSTYTILESDLAHEISAEITATNAIASTSIETIEYNIAPNWAQGVNLWKDFIENIGTSETVNDAHPTELWAPNDDNTFVRVGVNELTLTDDGIISTPSRTNLLRTSANFSPLGDSFWFNQNTMTIGSSVNSIFDVSGDARPHTGTDVISQARTQSFTLAVSTVYTFSVIIENVDSLVTAIGIGDSTPGAIAFWRGRIVYTWETNSITAPQPGYSAPKVYDMGIGPNGGALRRLELSIQTHEVNTSYAFYLYPTGDGANSKTAILHHAQFEAGNYASPPILTTNASAIGNGNRISIDITGRATEGVAGVVQFELKNNILNIARHCTFTSGTSANTVDLATGFLTPSLTTFYQFRINKNSQSESSGNTVINVVQGLTTIAFAAGPDYAKYLVVGRGVSPLDTIVDYPGENLTTLGIGGYGFANGSNAFSATKKLALRFGPVNDDVYNEMVALAQIAAVS